jgi:regulator of sigma E protease
VLTLLSFILMLGVIIFVHEFGHFLTAKLFGMRVFVFSFGFGKRLAGFKWGDTDLRLSLVPLGGYVKLEGEPEDFISEGTPASAGLPGEDPSLRKVALSDGEIVSVENPDYFTARPRWQRFLVYLAGPFMNAVLTISVITVFHMRGFGVEATLYEAPVVGAVEAGTPAAAAGLQPGDRFLALDGQPVQHWEAVHYALALRPNRDVRLRTQRGAQTSEITVRTGVEKGQDSEIGRLDGVHPLVQVGEVAPGLPAAQAGVRPDDAILSINGQPIKIFTDIPALLAGSAGKPLALRLWRQGQVVELSVTPVDTGQGTRLGISSKVVIRKFGFTRAVREALIWTRTQTLLTFEVVKRLVTAQLSPRTIMGPLGIARASGDAARQGTGPWFILMAAISLQVGILNLFPLAPLDGGHLAILGVEGVLRRDVSPTAKAWIINAGAIFLFALIGLVLYSDLAKTGWIQKLFQ